MKIIRTAEDKVKDEDLQDYQSFSWSFVNVPKEVSDKLKEFQGHIPDEELFKKKEGDWTYGLEDEHHIIVKWGIHTNNAEAVKEVIDGQEGGEVKLGDVDIFENDEYDVLKVNIISKDLHRLNKRISDGLEVTDTHPEYKPHMTIAYLKVGEGEKYIGDDFFKDLGFDFDEIVFEDQDDNETKIGLK